MKTKAVSSTDAPKAIGPYSQAIEGGGLLFCSGQIPLDPATGEIVPGDIATQTRQVMENLKAVLLARGLDFTDVAKMTVLLSDMADFAAVNEIYGSYLSEPFPARACFAVKELPKGVAVEIEAIAVL